MAKTFTLSAIQATPHFFDREKSTDKACSLIEKAGRTGADLAAFGETWLPGYPFFTGDKRQATIAYFDNGVEIPSETTDRLCQVAGDAGIDVAIGVVERDRHTRGTTYCTLLFIGKEGTILGRHRKLKPTHNERTFWGDGDAEGLRVYERPYARIGGLNCGENCMMLPGYALVAQGIQVHVATWPFPQFMREGELLSRAFALQGRCYVVAVAALYMQKNLPESFAELHRESFIAESEYGSCIIDPNGKIVAKADSGEETIITAEGSLDEITYGKYAWDIAGHYSRPDVFHLTVNRRPMKRIHTIEDVEHDEENADVRGLGT